jgi:hypothetical protein
VAVTTTRASIGVLIVLLLAATALRLLALEVEGHNGDVRVTAGWAERLAEVGPWRFYEGSSSVYPALLLPLWGIGLALDGDALLLAIKGLALPFDLAIGILLYAILAARGAPWAGVAASALFLLNPAALLAGPVWGQVDSAGTLPYLGALVALAAKRYGLAGGLGVVATLVKPQFGLVMLPILAVAALRWYRNADHRPLASTVFGSAVAAALVMVPLALDPLRYLGILGDTASRQPSTSLNAFNWWGLLVGFKIPDDPYVGIGTALLAVGVAGSMLALRDRPRLASALAVGALLVLAFYFLPTRVHERYLYPAIVLLAPFAVAGRAPMAAYLALSAGFAASLLYALHDTTPFTLPEPIATWITSTAGVWAIGLLLIGSAVAWTWLLLAREPQAPGRETEEAEPRPRPAQQPPLHPDPAA